MRVPFVRVAIASLALCLCTTVRAAEEQKFKIRVLHTTDLHGALAAWDDWADKPAARGLE